MPDSLAARIAAHIEQGAEPDPAALVRAHPRPAERSRALAQYRFALEPPPAWALAACADCMRGEGAPEAVHGAWALFAHLGGAPEPWMAPRLEGAGSSLDPEALVDLAEARAHLGLPPPEFPIAALERMSDPLLARALRFGAERAAGFLSAPLGGPPPPRPDMRRRRLIGRGAGGRVYRVGDRAVKVVDDLSHPQMVMRERNALMLLRHPNLVRGLSAWIDARGAPCMEMELAPHGRICDHPPARAAFGWVAEQLLGAADYLAAAGLVHGDVRPANVLVFGPRLVKLCDFELAMSARSITDASWYDFGPEAAGFEHPPECFGGAPAPADPFRVDWWGVGRVLFGLARESWEAAPVGAAAINRCVRAGWVARGADDVAPPPDPDPRLRACYHLMRLEAALRDRAPLREAAALGPARDLPCAGPARLEAEEEPARRKRARPPALRAEVFEFWEGCEDAAYLDPRARELLCRRL